MSAQDIVIVKESGMSLVRISEKLAIAEQPSPGAFRQFKAEVFPAVIKKHPNGEEPHQPGSAAEKCAAEDAGLGYRFIPVTSPQITEADVLAFQKAVADAPGPVLAHCGRGTRSLTLYAIGEVLDRRMNPEDIRPFGERFGFDLTVAEQWIARRGKQRPTVKGFFDPRTSSVQYVVSDPATAKCAIIDPVLDFNERSGGTATWSADAILAHVAKQQLTVEWISRHTHPCRPFLGGALPPAEDRGADGDWRSRARCAAALGHDLQLAVGIERGAVLGPPVRRWRAFRDRLARCAGRVLARPYPRLDHLSDR